MNNRVIRCALAALLSTTFGAGLAYAQLTAQIMGTVADMERWCQQPA